MIGMRHYVLAWVALGGAIALAWVGRLHDSYAAAIGVILGAHFGASLLSERGRDRAGSNQ